jgi:hypothetical protein
MDVPAGQAAVMKTIMCDGDSNTWGCIPPWSHFEAARSSSRPAS